MTEPQKPIVHDALGLAPYGESIKIVTQGVVEGAKAFLSRVCLAAAEELGGLVTDQVRHWRSQNAARLAAIAEKKLNGAENVHCPPKIAIQILEKGSWEEDAGVQEMWAGLLASSCSEPGGDDSNLLFINKLGSMTGLQARILCYVVENATIRVSPNDLVSAEHGFIVDVEVLKSITGEVDIQRLDREIDDLREVGLLTPDAGISLHNSRIAHLTPSPLALHFYVRCKGSRLSPAEFYAP
jgi:hypothetical protein